MCGLFLDFNPLVYEWRYKLSPLALSVSPFVSIRMSCINTQAETENKQLASLSRRNYEDLGSIPPACSAATVTFYGARPTPKQ